MAASHKEYLRRAPVCSLIRLHERAVHPCHPLSIALGKSPVNLQNKLLLCVYFSFLFYFFLETCIYYLGNEPPSMEQTVLWQKRWDILPWTSQKQCHWSSLCHPLTPPRLCLTRLRFLEARISPAEREWKQRLCCASTQGSLSENLSEAHYSLAHRYVVIEEQGDSPCVILILRLLGLASSADAEEDKTVGSAEIRDYAKCNCSPV